jgi:hypothetical protein
MIIVLRVMPVTEWLSQHTDIDREMTFAA